MKSPAVVASEIGVVQGPGNPKHDNEFELVNTLKVSKSYVKIPGHLRRLQKDRPERRGKQDP